MAPAPASASPLVLSLPTQPLLSAISIHPVGSPSRHRHQQGEQFPVFFLPALFIPRSSSPSPWSQESGKWDGAKGSEAFKYRVPARSPRALPGWAPSCNPSPSNVGTVHTPPPTSMPLNISSLEKSPVTPHPQRAVGSVAGQPHSPQQLLVATGCLKQGASHRAPRQCSQPCPTMDSAYELSHIRKLQAQHMRMQEKTFTNWINNVFQHSRVSGAGRDPQPSLLSPQAPWPVASEGQLRGHLAEMSRTPQNTAEPRAPSLRKPL